MIAPTRSDDTVIRLCAPAERAARCPEHLDLARMQRRYGRILGTVRVWQGRVQARRDIQRLALWGSDSVLEDVGITRSDAEREARRWFWQDFLL
ncbi:MAG: DUF1127 domain-containing protein [Alkalilacustris sp.]